MSEIVDFFFTGKGDHGIRPGVVVGKGRSVIETAEKSTKTLVRFVMMISG